MPLDVITWCSYLVGDHHAAARQDVWHAHKVRCAIKGKPVKGWATLSIRGRPRTLNQATSGHLVRWAGQVLADQLIERGTAPPFVLVPIPNSATLVGSEPPATFVLAQRIAAAVRDPTATAHDILRWRRNLGKASEGQGSRDPQILYPNFATVSKLERGTRVVLVDDVKTSGGHMQAAAAKLRDSFRADVLVGVVVVTATYEAELPEDCLTPRVVEVHDWARSPLMVRIFRRV